MFLLGFGFSNILAWASLKRQKLYKWVGTVKAELLNVITLQMYNYFDNNSLEN